MKKISVSYFDIEVLTFAVAVTSTHQHNQLFLSTSRQVPFPLEISVKELLATAVKPPFRIK
jgi:hypothetical protein